jgi:hypothetical protein
MVNETVGSPVQPPELKIYNNPYVRVVVDTVDHNNVQYYELNTWTKSTTDYNYNHDDRRLVGLVSFSAATSIDLTKSITLPKSGWYQIEIGYRKHPSYTGGFTLYDGSTQIDQKVSSHSNHDFMVYEVYKPHYYSSGSHTFKITVTRPAVVRDIVIKPLTRYEGDNQNTPYSHTHRLDFNDISFSQNSVAEVNQCSITLPMREEYFKDYDWTDDNSPYVFHQDDSVTVYMGETMNTTQPVFGGYIKGVSYSGGELELTSEDRLTDLDRVPLYQNFSIGGVPAPEGSTRPFTSFPSVYELARYLAETSRYPLKAYMVPYEYAVKLDFSTIGQYNHVNVATWNKYYDTKNGHPAPSMKLSVGSSTGTAMATLYDAEGDPYDANTYGMMAVDYYASGSGAKYPITWNLIVNMHKKSETIANALDYTVQVNGGSGTNPISSYTSILNGEWQRLTIDLKAALTKVGASSNYYINSIRLEGTVSETQLTQRRCSTLWIGGLYCYKSINHVSKYASQDVKSPLEELRQLCERTAHAAYVSYGDTREDDVLVVSPMEYETADVAVTEGSNLLELDGVDYNPQDDEYTNYYHMTFNFDNNNGGASRRYDIESAAHYREYQRHEFNSDVGNQVDADSEVETFLSFHRWPRIGFTVKIRGTSNLIPEQYAVVSIPSHRINGSFPVKSITHEWNRSSGYITNVDFGKPSNRFRKFINVQKRAVRDLVARGNANRYTSGVNSALGGMSPGAFVDY